MKTEAIRRKKHWLWVGLLAAALASGCQSILPEARVDPTRFYVLASTPTGAALPAKARQVGLRTVELPGYLRATKSLVTKTGGNEVKFIDYHRWAEPLDAGVSRVLKERLANQVAVSAVPFSIEVKRDYDVAVRILRCEGESTPEGSRAVLVANYQILRADGSGEVLVAKRFEAATTAWDGANYGSLAEALSRAVEGLADQIASEIP